jgi:hypothetical protein
MDRGVVRMHELVNGSQHCVGEVGIGLAERGQLRESVEHARLFGRSPGGLLGGTHPAAHPLQRRGHVSDLITTHRREGDILAVLDVPGGLDELGERSADPAGDEDGREEERKGAKPWRWPWRLAFTQRIELVAADGLAGTAGTELLGRPPTNG